MRRGPTCSITSSASTTPRDGTRRSDTSAPWTSRNRPCKLNRVSTKPAAAQAAQPERGVAAVLHPQELGMEPPLIQRCVEGCIFVFRCRNALFWSFWQRQQLVPIEGLSGLPGYASKFRDCCEQRALSVGPAADGTDGLAIEKRRYREKSLDIRWRLRKPSASIVRMHKVDPIDSQSSRHFPSRLNKLSEVRLPALQCARLPGKLRCNLFNARNGLTTVTAGEHGFSDKPMSQEVSRVKFRLPSHRRQRAGASSPSSVTIRIIASFACQD